MRWWEKLLRVVGWELWSGVCLWGHCWAAESWRKSWKDEKITQGKCLGWELRYFRNWLLDFNFSYLFAFIYSNVFKATFKFRLQIIYLYRMNTYIYRYCNRLSLSYIHSNHTHTYKPMHAWQGCNKWIYIGCIHTHTTYTLTLTQTNTWVFITHTC